MDRRVSRMCNHPISYPAFRQALPILKRIEDNGYQAYFVGGSVRDALLGKPVNDIDIATSAKPEEIKSLFKRTVDIGIEHGTVLVLSDEGEYEITTFRTESTYHDFRRPDEVTFVRSLKEDLQRRDFTINALALSRRGELIDYYGGQIDLKKQLIRAVGCPKERFSEDALRMLRAIRFASQLDFDIESETFLAIKTLHPLLDHIATERIAVEFEKTLMGKNHAKGLHTLIESGLFNYCPGLSGGSEALSQLSKIKSPFLSVESAWALLVFFMQKTGVLSPHQQAPHLFLKKWKLSNKKIDGAIKLLNGLIYRAERGPLTSYYLFEYGQDNALLIEDLMHKLGEKDQSEIVQKIARQLPIVRKKDLAISGRDLMEITGERAGPWIGQWLNDALQAVIDGQIKNHKKEIIDYLTAKYMTSGGGD